jgi:DNA-entry nuclease
MYRVTPLYNGYELVARGVLMEAWSVEDDGDGVCFCVFVYNVQPGIEINYFNGVNRVTGDSYVDLDQPVGYMEHFVLNKKSLKYHMPDCVYAENLKEENRIDFNGRIPELEAAYPGCEPCGVCFKDD